MIEQTFLQLSERENRELCAELLKKGSHFWESYASKPGNLNFFDGIMHMLTLPSDSLELSLKFIIYPLNDLNKKNALKIADALMSIQDARHSQEIDISDDEENYLVGWYFLLRSILEPNMENRKYGLDKIYNVLRDEHKKINISLIKKQVKEYTIQGHDAPDVN